MRLKAFAGCHLNLTASGGTFVVATSSGDAYTFNSSGTLTAYEDANGGRLQPSYTSIKGAQRLASIQDPGSTSTTAKYNEDGTLAELVTPASEHYYYEYISGSESGVRLLASVKNGTSGVTTSISYSTSAAPPSAIAVTTGHKTKLSYDWANRVATVEQINSVEPSDVTTTITYSAPTSSACEAADVGETIVTGGQDAVEQVYCYNATGQVTNNYGGD